MIYGRLIRDCVVYNCLVFLMIETRPLALVGLWDGLRLDCDWRGGIREFALLRSGAACRGEDIVCWDVVLEQVIDGILDLLNGIVKVVVILLVVLWPVGGLL
jgi:hypothetical protein